MLSIPQLADDFEGRVIAPDDPDYESARTGFADTGVFRHFGLPRTLPSL